MREQWVLSNGLHALCVLASAVFFAGCAQEAPLTVISTIITIDVQAVARDDRGALKERIFNVRPMYGLAVGVSFYSAKAQPTFDSKPAHALSAALVIDTMDRNYQFKFQPSDHRRLLTDLRLPVGAMENLAVLDHLAQSIGVDALNNPSISPLGPSTAGLLSNRDGTFPYFGDNRLVSGKTIVDEVQRALRDMGAGVAPDQVGTALFYFSAHGTLGPGGALYLAPADAEANNPATWLKADDLLAPIYAFAAEGGNTELKRRILVILDVCQQGNAAGAVPLAPPPRGVAVIQSASPGQYAWHFASKSRVTETLAAESVPPTTQDVRLTSTMSFLPISLRRSFAGLGASLTPIADPPAPGVLPQMRYVQVGDLFGALKQQMEQLAASDRAVMQAGGQTISIAYGDGSQQMNFLALVNTGDTFDLATSKREGRVYAEQFH